MLINRKKHHSAPSRNILDLRAGNVHHADAPGETTHQEKRSRRQFHMPRPAFHIHWNRLALRGLLHFFVVSALVVLPVLAGFAIAKIHDIRGEVLTDVQEAYESLNAAKDRALSLDFVSAGTEFQKAGESFRNAMKTIPVSERTLGLLAGLPTGDFVENAYHTLIAGRVLSESGEMASTILAPTAAEGVHLDTDGFPTVSISAQLVSPEWLTVQERLAQGLGHLMKIHPDALPAAYQEQFQALSQYLPLITQTVQRIDDVQELLRYFLGFDGRKEFAIWFQNTSELRATGGFLGSFAVISADNGTLSVIDVPGKGAYSLNDFITKHIIPPAPLQLINKHWQMQDANWWPDFPTSAEKFNAFYVLARGFPVDGIIAVTPDLVTELLGITGSITLDAYGVQVTEENFLAVTQEKASEDFNRAVNEPKKFIADLIPVLFSNVLALSTDEIPGIVDTFSRALSARTFQLYSQDEDIQQRLHGIRWSGEMLAAPMDALSVVFTNIGGGKTDDVMDTNLVLETHFTENQEIEQTLRITRAHEGDPADPAKGIKNMSYVRVYVPAGSTFLSGSGFTEIDRNLLQTPDTDAEEDEMLQDVSGDARIDEESGVRLYREFDRDVFGFWIGTEAKKQETATITYRVPFALTPDAPFGYSLFIQRQAGLKTPTLQHTLTVPSDYTVSWVDDAVETIQLGPEVIQYNKELTGDFFLGAAIEKK